MKRTALFCLLICVSVTGWATAGTPEAPQASLEELRAAIFVPSVTGEALLGGDFKGSCTVSNDCGPNSPTISCTSASGNCTSGSTYVTCDGNRINCPPCAVSTRCASGERVSCTGTTTTDCKVFAGCSVMCSGVLYGCNACY
jgi:hypothetical protein